MLVDLHLHTTCSDGTWSPERLFAEIRARELDAFCVSDHDTLDAYPVPEDLQSRAISGLEVDAHHAGHSAHILAYGVDNASSPLLTSLIQQRNNRLERMHAMVERCNQLGLAVTLDDVRRQARAASSLGRPHLARALLERGYVTSVQDAFDRYLADDGEGYVALDRLNVRDAVTQIHESGGVAVVAHPMRLREERHLVELVALGVDGIEVLHPTATAADSERLASFAAERGLLVTGGTDFHAPVAGRPLGVELPERALQELRARIERALAK
ncbi:MAG: PHP domain-containing protein [Candidatus Aquilonibacter sp.]